MNPIDTILDEIIRREGGYVNHPADRGGPTNFGITAQTLGSWRKLGRPATAAEVQALTETEARAIYRQQYITGQVMPTNSLNTSDLAEWRYRHAARKPGGSGTTSDRDTQKTPTTATGGTKAYWWDFEKGERREVTTGQPPFEEIRYVHATEAEAKAAAATRKNTGERGQGELSFSLPGDPRLAAEGRLSISLRPGIPTEWRIKRVEHRLGTQGYTTQVECERFTASPVPVTDTPAIATTEPNR